MQRLPSRSAAWRTLQGVCLGLCWAAVGAQAVAQPASARLPLALKVPPALIAAPAPEGVPVEPPAVSGGASPAAVSATALPLRSTPDPACANSESLHTLEVPASGGVEEIRFGLAGQRCLQAAGASVPWVALMLSRQSGVLRLAIAPNTSEQARQTEVQVVHNNDSGSVWVTQAGVTAAAPAPAAAAPVALPADAATGPEKAATP